MNRALGKVDKRFGGMSSSLKRFASVAAVVGLAVLTKRAIASADRIGKLADAIGISTDALQEYRHAAELSGVATEKFDKSLLQFAKRIGEGREETGALVEFLRRNNQELLTTILNTKSTGEALDVMFEALANTADATGRAALANAAFGRSGVEMVNMVRDGITSLRGMREEARRLGLVLDESMVREAEAANDQIERMSRILGVNLQRVLLTLAPTIIAVGDAFVASAPAIAAWASAFATLAFGDVARSTADLKAKVAQLRIELEEMEDVFSGQTGLLEDEGDPAAVRKTIAGIEAIIAARERSALSMKILLDSLKDDTAGGAKKTFDDLLAGINDRAVALGEEQAKLNRTTAEWERYRAVQDAVAFAKQNGINLSDKQVELLADEADNVKRLAEQLEGARQRQKELDDTTRRSARTFDAVGRAGASAFADIVIGIDSAADAARRLISTLARLLVFGPLEAALSAAIGGALGGAQVGGTGGGTQPLPIAAAHGVDFMVGGRGGTDANFVPLQVTRGERVSVETPAQQRAGRTGGGDVYHIDARGADGAGLRRLEALIAALHGSIERRAVDAVADASRRRPALLGGR
jgi:hypothetical protein